MITAYLLVVSFVLGMFVRSGLDGPEKPSVAQWFVLVGLSIFWPLMVYIYWKDWKEGKL